MKVEKLKRNTQRQNKREDPRDSILDHMLLKKINPNCAQSFCLKHELKTLSITK